MLSISYFSYFSQTVFDELIVKEGEIMHKVDWTLANRVVDLGEVFEFELFLPVLFCFWAFLSSSLPFYLVCRFTHHFLALRFFLLLDDLLSFTLAFDLLAMFHCVIDSKCKHCAFCYQWTHQGEDWETKWSVPWFDCDEPMTCCGLISNLGYFRGSILLHIVRVENHVWLSRGVHVTGTTWWAAMRIMTGVRDLVQRIRDG
jgi:hypothetical protein